MDVLRGRLKRLAMAFYAGWKWSLTHQYTEQAYEEFVNKVEEPMNELVTKLRNQGVPEIEIECIFQEAKAEVGFFLCDSLKKQVI